MKTDEFRLSGYKTPRCINYDFLYSSNALYNILLTPHDFLRRHYAMNRYKGISKVCGVQEALLLSKVGQKTSAQLYGYNFRNGQGCGSKLDTGKNQHTSHLRSSTQATRELGISYRD